MRIAVCIKQVPVVAALQIDAATKTVKREGVPTEVSAFDIRALLKAVELRDLHGGEVLVVTMGPPAARSALEECLALGADRALHLNDRAFAGADTLATARTLALALRREPIDLILCGRNSVDAETGHIGPQLAELLDWPQVTSARTLKIDVPERRLIAEREIDEGIETIRAPLPAVVTAAEDLAPERFPSKADREAAKARTIDEIDAVGLGADGSQLGSAGSPTWVTGLIPVPSGRRARIIEGGDAQGTATALVDILTHEHGLFGTWNVGEPPAIAASPRPVRRDRPGSIWVLAEEDGQGLRRITFELLGKARTLADASGGDVAALALGSDMARHASALIAHGADRVLLAEGTSLLPFQVETWVSILAAWIGQAHPGMLLMPGTAIGRDLAPRLAARLGIGLTSDCVDLGLDEAGCLVQFKPAFGGSIVAPILSRTVPEMATVRPGMLPLPRPRTGLPNIIERPQLPPAHPPRSEVIARHIDAGNANQLDHADIVVGVGHGIGSAENLALLRPLTELLGATLCTTRDVTDAGWLPRQLQVGLTGRAIAPKLYFAVAIRGAFEHTVGVRRAGVVVALNKSPKAPIFKAADYGIVGDFQVLVPALVDALQRAKSSGTQG